MANLHESTDERQHGIERDVASFADPATLVRVAAAGNRFRATWKAHGEQREIAFPRSGDESGYRSLIAGPKFADLMSVARMIGQASTPTGVDSFIDTMAERQDAENTENRAMRQSSVDLLTTLIEKDTESTTQVIMLTGDAGAGKTCVLKELVRRQADRYIRGQTTKLLLYVNAQGRALARLNEALATELQDLKVGLTYHSIAVLARLGVLVPVIDGFDELLGVSGYDDAFGSLAGLLEQLEGRGHILASARSVYYEEEFLSRAAKIGDATELAWTHIPVRLCDWSETDRNRYIDAWAKSEDMPEEEVKTLRANIKHAFADQERTLGAKPLFFTRIASLLRRNPGFSSGRDPLHGLADLLHGLAHDYMQRERKEKLLDRNFAPLLTQEQFERLMRELAEEMWNQDTRELDYPSVRYVAEYVVESEDLSEMAKRTVIERMPTLAFLAQGGDPASHSGAFEHELFFFYFLGISIAHRLSSSEGDMRIVLSRSALPEDVADRTATVLGQEPRRLQEFVKRLVQAGKTEWSRKKQVKENSGLLIMALFRERGEIEGCSVGAVVFPGGHFRGVRMRRCSFTEAVFRRTNLDEARFEDCEAREVLFVEPFLNPGTTRLNMTGIDSSHFVGVRVPDGVTVYNPSFVADRLRECGAPVSGRGMVAREPGVPPGYVQVLERLMAAYRRANPVCADDDRLGKIFSAPEWGTLENLLIGHKLIVKETGHPGGAPITLFRRRFIAEQLMSGLNGDLSGDRRVDGFWRALAAEARKNSGIGG